MDRKSLTWMRNNQTNGGINMVNNNQAAINVQDREIIVDRTLNATRELVWEVWTQPEHL